MKTEHVGRLFDALILAITAWQTHEAEDAFFDPLLDQLAKIKADNESGDLSDEDADLQLEQIEQAVRERRDAALSRL